MGNELVAEVKESETVWTGSRLLEDGADLKEAFESKSWVAGGLAMAATAADAAAAAIDPLGEALSAGVGWVIEHLSPLKDWLNELAGDSDAVTAAASTWTNIATKLSSCASDLDTVCSSRLAGQESLAVATFKTLQAGSASHLRMTGGVAGAISGGLTVASMIVRMVHDMVRDAISDVIGKLLSKASITVLTAGLAAPWAVSSVATDVSSWATRLAKEVTDVVTSAKNLKGLLSKANHLLNDVGQKFAGMVTMALGYGSKNAGNAAKGAKHADDAANAAKGAKHADDAADAAKGAKHADDAADAAKGAAAASAVPPKKGGGGTPPSDKGKTPHSPDKERDGAAKPAPKKNGGKARPEGPFPDVQSVRGRPADDVLDIIPDDWIADTPRKEPDGIRFRNPHRNGEQIIYEPGKPWAKDPLHSGPYIRVSEGGKTYRIPLEGNPAL